MKNQISTISLERHYYIRKKGYCVKIEIFRGWTEKMSEEEGFMLFWAGLFMFQ